MSVTTEGTPATSKEQIIIEGATVRLAGDSGDGMQLAGSQLTGTSAQLGNDVATFPDFPAEIRAPRGTLAGVSGFQVHFSSDDIFTPGDALDALVVMNPAALKTNLGDLRKGGILIANADNFEKKDNDMAGYASNPLDSEVLEHTYQLFKVPMTRITRDALKDMGMSQKEIDRCKNFFALGLVYWLYGRDLDPTIRFLNEKFGSKPEIAEAKRKQSHAIGFPLARLVRFGHPPASEETPIAHDRMGALKQPAICWMGLAQASFRPGGRCKRSSYPSTISLG